MNNSAAADSEDSRSLVGGRHKSTCSYVDMTEEEIKQRYRGESSSSTQQYAYTEGQSDPESIQSSLNRQSIVLPQSETEFKRATEAVG